MLQIKIIQGLELDSLVNEFLATIDEDSIKEMDIDVPKQTAIIQYLTNEGWEKRMCCECQFWDDGGETNTTGLCQATGKRIRFNCRACKEFKDVRG